MAITPLYLSVITELRITAATSLPLYYDFKMLSCLHVGLGFFLFLSFLSLTHILTAH